MARANKWYLILTLISILVFDNAGLSQQRKITAQTIVKRMAQRYASCMSYQDSGVVETTYHEEASARIEKMPFKTYFRRPQFFRFEWIDYSPWKDGRERVVWGNGKEAYIYLEPDVYEKAESLGLSIAGATGISRGAAHTVSRLLMGEEVSGFALTDLTNLVLIGEEAFEGELCYRITGRHPFGDLYALWIGKGDYLVRKIRTESKEKDYSVVEEEIHRNIKINGPIANDVFNFTPQIPITEQLKVTPVPGDMPGEIDEKPTWTEFHSPEGRFKLLMPGTPAARTLTLETATEKVVHNIFAASKGGVFCLVGYADMPKQMTEPGSGKAVLDEARDGFIKSTEGKVVSEAIISLDGYTGREIKVNFPGGEAKCRFYLVDGRFYQIVIITFSTTNKSSNDVDKFFDSFKLTGETKKVAVFSIYHVNR